MAFLKGNPIPRSALKEKMDPIIEVFKSTPQQRGSASAALSF